MGAAASGKRASCRDPSDAERCSAIREIASEMMARGSDGGSAAALARLFAGARLLLVREREGQPPSINALREVKE